jgi:hypothetical protein
LLAPRQIEFTAFGDFPSKVSMGSEMKMDVSTNLTRVQFCMAVDCHFLACVPPRIVTQSFLFSEIFEQICSESAVNPHVSQTPKSKKLV